jgi:cytochrome c oxidase subunit 1
MGSINVIVTIMNMRAPGMDLMKMPLFVWSWLITAYLLIAVMPVLAGAVTMMLMDIHFGTSFFNAAGGGDPVLFQHIFWFFGHPEVYIMILPAFGIISHIIETFSRKQLFGYESMVWAMLSIAILSFVVWAHHMFTVGMPLAAELFFMWATMLIAVPTGVKVFNWVATMFKGSISFETPMLFAIAFVVWAHHMFTVGMPLAAELFFMWATMLIAVPTGVKVFNWVATMFKGSITYETPMLFAISFVVLFTIGGFSGLMLSIVPADFQYHDTYFVVAHFHYVLVPGSIFSIMAAVYYWIPKWTGNMYDERMGRLHFWLSFVGVNVTFFPQHWIGLAGMPRRHPDYALQFADWNMVSTAGAFLFGASQILFLFIVLKTVMGGKKATPQVWEGARGLEWSVESPAPYHTFSTPPKVN